VDERNEKAEQFPKQGLSGTLDKAEMCMAKSTLFCKIKI
jgi:hypothetical protein